MLPNPDRRLNAFDIASLKTPIIYGWRRYNKYLYIGQSKRGIIRLLSHDKIGKEEEFCEEDIIDIWSVELDQIDELEESLIKKYIPKYNIALTGKLVRTVVTKGGVKVKKYIGSKSILKEIVQKEEFILDRCRCKKGEGQPCPFCINKLREKTGYKHHAFV